MPNVMQFYGNSTQQQVMPHQTFNIQPLPQFSKGSSTQGFGGAVDDMQLNRNMAQDQAKRYRRRSIHTIDASEYSEIPAGLSQQGSRQVSSANGRIDQQQHPLRSSPVLATRPESSHGKNGSTESVNSIRSSHHSRPNSVCYSLNSTLHSPVFCTCIECKLSLTN
jgi:hypothetical protein